MGTAFAIAFAAFLGLTVGSFLNVCIYRMPRPGISVSRPRRSFCPSCGMAISWEDNIPVLSYLSLGGRCRGCRIPISARYILVEALTALLFVLVARRYVLEPQPSGPAFAAGIALVSALVVASFIDLELRILPDPITIGGMLAAPVVLLLVPDFHTRPVDGSVSRLLHDLEGALRPVAADLPALHRSGAVPIAAAAIAGGGFFIAGLFCHVRYRKAREPKMPHRPRQSLLAGWIAGWVGGMALYNFLRPDTLLFLPVHSFWAGLVGMLAGSSLVFTVGLVGSRVFKKPAMGFGDVKLMGFLGAFAGWAGIIAAFFLACFLGSVVGIFLLIRYRSHYLPFGPFLAMGALAMILFRERFEAVLLWYMNLF